MHEIIILAAAAVSVFVVMRRSYPECDDVDGRVRSVIRGGTTKRRRHRSAGVDRRADSIAASAVATS